MSSNAFVYVIILNWNNAEDTIECIDSLLQSTYSNYKIILIDNGSKDNSFKILYKKYSSNNIITVLKNSINTGFTGGNNRGIAFALKNGADYIFLLNNDTIVSPDLIENLLQPFKAHKRLAVTTPKIYLYQNKSMIWSAGGNVDPETLKVSMHGCGKLDLPEFSIAKECSFATGCAMFMKASSLHKCGNFDEDLFHSGEDLDLSIRFIQAGYSIQYVPSAVLWHKVMGSTGKSGKMSPLGAYYEYRNLLMVFKKHGYLRSFRAKLLIIKWYQKMLAVFLIKEKNIKIFLAICVGIFDFAARKKGAFSHKHIDLKR